MTEGMTLNEFMLATTGLNLKEIDMLDSKDIAKQTALTQLEIFKKQIGVDKI